MKTPHQLAEEARQEIKKLLVKTQITTTTAFNSKVDSIIEAAIEEATEEVEREWEKIIAGHAKTNQDIVDDRNKQLAAEQGLHKTTQLALGGAIKRLQQQLADEQKKYDFKANLTEEIVSLNKQLAAEHKKVEELHKILGQKRKRIKELQNESRPTAAD